MSLECPRSTYKWNASSKWFQVQVRISALFLFTFFLLADGGVWHVAGEDVGALELELRNGNDKILGSAQIKISDVLAAGGMKLLGMMGVGLLNSNHGPPRHFGTTLSFSLARWRDDRRLALKHATGRTAIFSRRIADSPAIEILVILIKYQWKGLISMQCPEFAREVLGWRRGLHTRA